MTFLESGYLESTVSIGAFIPEPYSLPTIMSSGRVKPTVAHSTTLLTESLVNNYKEQSLKHHLTYLTPHKSVNGDFSRTLDKFGYYSMKFPLLLFMLINVFHIWYMYYEFGIFSTICEYIQMPVWNITHISHTPSIPFTIPCKIRGLDYFYVGELFELPMIRITNNTKNRTWIYKHCIKSIFVSGEMLQFLSHWMFGMNEMDVGDEITIKLETYGKYCIAESGVGLLYDVGSMEVSIATENGVKEDPLGYYKTWNHIIGGDLSAFQLTSGEYFLHTMDFFRSSFFNAHYKERTVSFNALSPRKCNIPVHAQEIVSPFPSSGKQGIAYIQMVSKEIVNMMEMNMGWVPYVPLRKLEREQEREQEWYLNFTRDRVDMINLLTTRVSTLTILGLPIAKGELAVKDLGPLSYFLGISVSRDPNGMFLSQSTYAMDILQRANMAHYNHVHTPVETTGMTSANGGTLIDDPTMYRRLAGAL
ncbi:uncharacterized protein LOC143603532 [Bidens hawaiensis]|uniref:uncharacterized protein LOC143603532 n=1 Tax=Bidens hawaiensis TaxID=980011 RepID=UPI004049BBD5